MPATKPPMRKATLLLVLTLAGVVAPAREGDAEPQHAMFPSMVIADFEPGFGFPTTRTTTTYAYDAKWHLLRELEERDALSDGVVDARLTTSFSYDARGNVTSKRIERDFQADGVNDVDEATIYAYDRRGFLTAQDTWSVSPFSSLVTASLTRRAYDVRGNAVLEITATFNDFDTEADRVSVVTSSYGHHGLLTSKRETIVDHAAASPLVFVMFTQYEYDRHRNLVLTKMETDFGADGAIDSVHTTENVYGAHGRLIEGNTYHDFDADGTAELVERIASTYDARGKLLEQTSTSDSLGDGSIEFSTADTYTYDEAGRLASKRHETSGDNQPTQTETSEYFY
jgi:hypothetical protein